ncbi:MAG TPA: hypothetical protein P5137_15645, partial [Candidatus Brocadiia bacterium]|nr:hypothetical protein [Candidatus Brocadiia bacterium]
MSSLRFVARLGALVKAQMMMFPGMQLLPSKKNPMMRRWQQTVEEAAPAPKAPQTPAPAPAHPATPHPAPASGGESSEVQAVRRALHVMSGAAERWDALRQTGATDEQLAEAIGREFGYQGGFSGRPNTPGAIVEYRGGKSPSVTIRRAASDTQPGKEETIKGPRLLAMARDILAIPKPGEKDGTLFDAPAPPAKAEPPKPSSQPQQAAPTGETNMDIALRSGATWMVRYHELRDLLKEASRGTLADWERVRRILDALWPEGVPLGNPDYTTLGTRHRRAVEAAIKAGQPVPSAVLEDYGLTAPGMPKWPAPGKPSMFDKSLRFTCSASDLLKAAGVALANRSGLALLP